MTSNCQLNCILHTGSPYQEMIKLSPLIPNWNSTPVNQQQWEHGTIWRCKKISMMSCSKKTDMFKKNGEGPLQSKFSGRWISPPQKPLQLVFGLKRQFCGVYTSLAADIKGHARLPGPIFSWKPVYMEVNWVVVFNIFYFHPYLGKIPILTNIFQMGWNH